MKRVVIVGSGPSALATVKTLNNYHNEFQITILDISGNEKQEKNVGLKSYFGSTGFYDTVESKIIHKSMNPVTWPSSGRGGYSRIWGAAVGEIPSSNFPNFINYKVNEESNEFSTKSSLNIQKRYLKRKNPNWKILNHVLAVDPKKCIKCGDCLTGCPKDAIWFAGDEWKDIKNVQFNENFRVHRLETYGDKVVLTSNRGENLEGDFVFIAAGAIASSQILMRSNLIDKTITIKDTAATFFPALRFPIRDGQVKFSLSQISARIKIGENDQKYIQIYPDSRMLAEPIIKHKPKIRFIIERTWRIISPFMLSIIMYESTSVSAKIRLTMVEEEKFELSKLKVQKTHKSIISKIRTFYYLFCDFGILPLIFLGKKGEAGESYHFGSIDQAISFNGDPANRMIRIVDASVLLSIEPGPITDKIMTNASQIVKDFLRERHEIFN